MPFGGPSTALRLHKRQHEEEQDDIAAASIRTGEVLCSAADASQGAATSAANAVSRGMLPASPRHAAKWARVEGAFKAVDGSFFERRQSAQKLLTAAGHAGGSLGKKPGGSKAESTLEQAGELARGTSGLASGHLSAFCEDLSRFTQYSELRVRCLRCQIAIVQHSVPSGYVPLKVFKSQCLPATPNALELLNTILHAAVYDSACQPSAVHA